MRSAKEITHDRKRKRESMSVRKTEESRTRRLANKAKRAEIHVIDPDAKITFINQVPYINDIEIKVVDNKIVSITNLLDVLEYSNEDEINTLAKATGKAIDAQVEKERLGVFSNLVSKFKKK